MRWKPLPKTSFSILNFSYRGFLITAHVTRQFNQDKKKRMNGGNGNGMDMDDFMEGE
ncbi:hypothetical protein K8I28_14625 [bacterium]|nr:hypothetical protein [bacterium]